MIISVILPMSASRSSSALWSIGIPLLVIGLIAALSGATGQAAGGQRHYW